jgi:hypothetical protein
MKNKLSKLGATNKTGLTIAIFFILPLIVAITIKVINTQNIIF